ncbi:MAG: hypothetical protein ABJH72_22350 [Reichenbachiella sp.]|uniref:hypothetical protein n=1 Tax=Reichenbachiella sp. TaxID=2184521 RepID=UPI00326560E7
MIRIKSKLTGKPRDVKWKFWIDSPEFKDTRNDWEIVEYLEPPVQLYKRPNIHSEFEEAGIHDKSVGVSMHNQKPQLYRFDELDPKNLESVKATSIANAKPKKKLFQFQFSNIISNPWGSWTSFEKASILLMTLAIIIPVILYIISKS